MDEAPYLSLVPGFALNEQMTYPWDNSLTDRGTHQGVTSGSVWNYLVLKEERRTQYGA